MGASHQRASRQPRRPGRGCGGDIFTVDASARVRQVYPNGLIATIAGNGTRGYTGDGDWPPRRSSMLPRPSLCLETACNQWRRVRADTATTPSGSSSMPATAWGQCCGQRRQFHLGSRGAWRGCSDLGSGWARPNLRNTSSTLPAPGRHQSGRHQRHIRRHARAHTVYLRHANRRRSPYSVAGSYVQVFVQYQGQTSAPVPLAVAQVAPLSSRRTAPARGKRRPPTRMDRERAAHPAKWELHLVVADRRRPDESHGCGRLAGSESPAAAGGRGLGDDWRTIRDAAVCRPGAHRSSRVMQINAQIPSGIQTGTASRW